jgi:hypothetical protein
MVARLNRIDGKLDPIPLDGERWFTHPAGDDLAVCLVGLNKRVHKFEYLAPGEWCGEGRVEMLNIGPGDDCFIVGRFISRDGKEKNVPTVRFGNIAQMPGEPIVQDDGFKQESFLVEARSIPGYSGSPVFIQIPATPQKINLPPHWPEHLKNAIHNKLYGQSGGERRASLPVPVGPWLLGIDYCHLHGQDKIISKTTRKPLNDDWYVRSNAGMMGVIPVWKLIEILEGSEMKPVIEAAKAAERVRRKKTSDAVSLDVAEQSGPPATDENPNHREDFERLLGKAAKPQKEQS